ncbi:hypothetical protein HRI96_08310 [Treponema parvum]|uniref:Uncharacterized protein n=1 Tax=Treponema parvum TaxID=138851 RepID=A0A975F0N7_9SPIR|nr:LPO_1073/Vpar_1526 family protein [Treponema parvum]QTQ12198.1 hypothetical protein HRI96_08310 [Treponema parvum]
MNEMSAKATNNSSINQINGNVTINNFIQIREIFNTLYELNFPKLVEAAEERARKNVEEFCKNFFSKIEEDERLKIQESLKHPNSQYILNSSINNAARFGDTSNLNILSEALKQALLVDDNGLTFQLNLALELIPQLNKNQLSVIVISFFIHTLSFRQNIPQLHEIFAASCLKNYLPTSNIKNNQIMHLVSLGIFSFNQFAGGTAMNLIKQKYPNNMELFSNIENGNFNTFKSIVDYYDSNSLIHYQPMPVANVIGFLLVKENIGQLDIGILR